MRKAISVGTGVLILAGLLGSPVQAGETEQVTGGVKKPKHTQATQPSAAGSQNPPAAVTSRGASGRGIQKMMEKRTQGFAKEWAGDAKSKIKPMLQELPLSPVFITQLIMNAALPSVGDVLAKTMNQGQLGGVFEGGTMGAMSTTMAGGGGGGGGRPDEHTLLVSACMAFGSDPEDCIEDPHDALTNPNKIPLNAKPPGTITLSGVLTNAGVDSLTREMLPDVTVSSMGTMLHAPQRTPASIVEEQLNPPTNPAPTVTPLAKQILDASDGSPPAAANKPWTAGDNQEFSAVLKKMGLPFSVFKLYMRECGNNLYDATAKERCEAMASLATMVAVGEAIKVLGDVEAQLAAAEASSAGWQLVAGDNPLFIVLEPHLNAALPRIQAMRRGLEASTGLTLAGYSERLQQLREIADAWDEQQLGHVRGRGK